uniref:Uncharacterized protein n=1 Tax=Arundo donax TaxID=35708 RepID=A0A0A8YBV8_ARUDO
MSVASLANGKNSHCQHDCKGGNRMIYSAPDLPEIQ